MTKINPTSLTPSGVIPNDPNPNDGKGIPFSLAVEDENISFEFNPVYYPDRYSDKMEKEVERDSRQCGGEDVSIDNTKNPEFHATGIVLSENVEKFRRIRNHNGPINLITPLTDNAGGMEVIVINGEIGELVGWDGMYEQWQFNYTLDMVATGFDTDDSGENVIVSEVLEDYREVNSDDTDDSSGGGGGGSLQA